MNNVFILFDKNENNRNASKPHPNLNAFLIHPPSESGTLGSLLLAYFHKLRLKVIL